MILVETKDVLVLLILCTSIHTTEWNYREANIKRVCCESEKYLYHLFIGLFWWSWLNFL